MANDSERMYYFCLSEKEVATLRRILENVGGSPINSARKHADTIFDYVCQTGVHSTNNSFTTNSRSLMFKDDPSSV